MKCFCDNCDCFVNTASDVLLRCNHTASIKGREITAEEEYLVCPECGGKVYTNEMVNANIHAMHNAYRLAIGSITAEEIREILNAYNIDAQHLSLLLGWGANTIERQMKHTIPDREHARRLRELNDPARMLELLENGKEAINEHAYRRAKEVAEASQFILNINGESKRPERENFGFYPDEGFSLSHGVKPFIERLRDRFVADGRITSADHEQEKRSQYQIIFAGG